MEDAAAIERALESDGGNSLRNQTFQGMTALQFCAAMYDEDLALRCLDAMPKDLIDAQAPGGGYTALHFSAAGGMPMLTEALLRCRASLEARTDQLSMPCGTGVQAAGRTPLHIAASHGSRDIVDILAAARADPAAADEDGNSAVMLALMANQPAMAARLRELYHLPGDAEEGLVEGKMKRDNDAAKERLKDSLEVSGALRGVHALPQAFTVAECETVLRAVTAVTDKAGWSTTRHTAYRTMDIPCSEVPEVDRWVRSTIEERVFPRMSESYDLPGCAYALHFRDLFFVKYCNESGGQPGLDLHKDGSILSFNILLNPAEEFVGGGTYFEHEDKNYCLTQGDCLTHSGKVNHAGTPISSGTRMVLVGFVDARKL